MNSKTSKYDISMMVFSKFSVIFVSSQSARVPFSIKLQAKARNLIKKETLAQVFSCEFCKISKKTFY